MEQKPRKRYSPEFKAQAVELLDTGKPVSQLAEELCISSNLLYKWRQDSQENALLRQENDILKKAAIILGSRPQHSSAK
jgi:transposase-like protein